MAAEPREGDAQVQINLRIISIALDRTSKPIDRLFAIADVELRLARQIHPRISHCDPWAEAQRLANASLHFFGATDVKLTKSGPDISRGKISI